MKLRVFIYNATKISLLKYIVSLICEFPAFHLNIRTTSYRPTACSPVLIKKYFMLKLGNKIKFKKLLLDPWIDCCVTVLLLRVKV